MGIILNKIQLNDYSLLKASFASACDDTVLVAKFEGDYRHGSSGSNDGLFMAATLAAHFALLEPVCLVLDLRELRYEWGNTILKAINFFYEFGRDEEEKNKGVVIVASKTVRNALAGLEQLLTSGRRIYCEDFDEALSIAEREAKAYLA
jgi:hypothetical protein